MPRLMQFTTRLCSRGSGSLARGLRTGAGPLPAQSSRFVRLLCPMTFWDKSDMRRRMIIGYGRTSTTDQIAGLAGQERDLKAAGAARLFTEQVSSVALNECLAFLREGDVLMVTKPDRLARSTAELLAIEADLSKRGVGLVVLSMGGERLDTRNPTAKLMLTVLAGVATWEREIMLERQRDGIAKAKREGKYKGRPASIDAAQIRRLTATMSTAAIAKQLGVARGTVYRLLEQTE